MLRFLFLILWKKTPHDCEKERETINHPQQTFVDHSAACKHAGVGTLLWYVEYLGQKAHALLPPTAISR
ncbi:hypothetical protein BN59_02039 [Legionella massiliensis]|uniref:Uncharacterized protein n=1 Tax=Legionella massiliensis TaxID=1034943 RepID=A0A078L136_9GAMM|nr:hypothetical protein [Legionella massiliensis]CDZ77749.1 hypothetical protein BN59_02039 [Legionella massiliensis]CEE13487.1 hypothetical protein BN1094_02039 [Legionella massiliensis]